MKRIVVLSCVMLLASAIPALAQKALAEAMARSAAGTFRNLVESAEKMPEADYGFQATKETRTFAGFVGHTVNAAFNSCSRAKGEANPNKEDLEKVTAKAKLVEAAKAVQTYCDAVFAAQTDASLAEMVAARAAAGAARSGAHRRHQPQHERVRPDGDPAAAQGHRAADDRARDAQAGELSDSGSATMTRSGQSDDCWLVVALLAGHPGSSRRWHRWPSRPAEPVASATPPAAALRRLADIVARARLRDPARARAAADDAGGAARTHSSWPTKRPRS